MPGETQDVANQGVAQHALAHLQQRRDQSPRPEDRMHEGGGRHRSGRQPEPDQAPAPNNSRPISIRRISFVPAPMSSSLASRQSRSTGQSFVQPEPPSAWIATDRKTDAQTKRGSVQVDIG